MRLLMKLLSLLLLLLVSSMGHTQESSRKLEGQLAERFGIRISTSKSSFVGQTRTETVGLFGWGGTKEVRVIDKSKPSSLEYSTFLGRLLRECQKREIGKRYIPFPIVVKKENWNIFDSNYFGPDLSVDRGVLKVGHESWKALLNEIQKYPVIGTKRAQKKQLRDESIASLIVEKMNGFKDQGVNVNSHKYVNYFWTISGRDFESKDIYYFNKEDFLQGLINLEQNIKDGTEYRLDIIITDKSYLRRENYEMHFDAPGSQDEKLLEQQIKRRMAELQE